MIFDIQRYSTHDGPGIRTVVFFKGCTLDCTWCQNPEGRRARQREVLFDPRLCLSGCAACLPYAPQAISQHDGVLRIERGRLSAGDLEALVDACPAQALSVCGRTVDLDAIMATVMRDAPFYSHSGGGITLSGGEPFLQPEAASALLARSREAGIHTAAESCLHVPWSYIEPSLPWLDLLLADLKHVDVRRFKQFTRGNLHLVLNNFRRLARRSVPMVVRVPLIPDFNADRESIAAICVFAAHELGVHELHFLPYHTLGAGKFALLGETYRAPARALDDPDLLEFAAACAQDLGMTAIIGG
jgi:pyruvate formate lyase activating enzyme